MAQAGPAVARRSPLVIAAVQAFEAETAVFLALEREANRLSEAAAAVDPDDEASAAPMLARAAELRRMILLREAHSPKALMVKLRTMILLAGGGASEDFIPALGHVLENFETSPANV